MGARWILAIAFCLLVLSGCSIGRTTVRPEIYGQFEKTGPIIRDTETRLEWQVGADRGTNWYEAKAWVDSLEGNWRMPTLAELHGLYNAGISVNSWGPFENDGWNVWSKEVDDSSSAWFFTYQFVLADSGREHCGARSDSGNGLRAFAVRFRIVEPEIYGQFEKVGPIIRDNVTGLEWQVGPDHNMTWDVAKAWVDSLGGGWRMPTMEELKSLWDAGIKYSANWGPFRNTGYSVWSGEVYSSSLPAWSFNFTNGREYWGLSSYSGIFFRAFAVRP